MRGIFAPAVDAAGDAEGYDRVLLILIAAAAAVRIALCFFPQNNWFRREGSRRWGILRNIPFLAVGLLTVLNLFLKSAAFGSPYLLLAVLVTLSFLCYMPVVLFSGKNPMVGMLMIPKTICYILIILVFL